MSAASRVRRKIGIANRMYGNLNAGIKVQELSVTLEREIGEFVEEKDEIKIKREERQQLVDRMNETQGGAEQLRTELEEEDLRELRELREDLNGRKQHMQEITAAVKRDEARLDELITEMASMDIVELTDDDVDEDEETDFEEESDYDYDILCEDDDGETGIVDDVEYEENEDENEAEDDDVENPFETWDENADNDD